MNGFLSTTNGVSCRLERSGRECKVKQLVSRLTCSGVSISWKAQILTLKADVLAADGGVVARLRSAFPYGGSALLTFLADS